LTELKQPENPLPVAEGHETEVIEWEWLYKHHKLNQSKIMVVIV
jgi:hypothetical protein